MAGQEEASPEPSPHSSPEPSPDSSPETGQAPAMKGLYIILMIFGAVLITAFAYYLFHSNSSGAGVLSCSDFSGNPPANSRGAPAGDRRGSYIRLPERPLEGRCDLFSGQWVYDPSGPVYTNISCNFIEAPQNCMRNGRPDVGYLYWKWRPYGCELPAFDPIRFLDAMRDKSWAFIGDSILRNHIQSMLCLLSKVQEPVEVYHDKPFKSRTWYFATHNFTVAVIWSPFLAKSETYEDDEGKSKSVIQLHLDILEEKWTSEYHRYDYMIFSGGQWFLKTMIMWIDNTIVGCHNCNKNNLKELGVDCPYRKVLQTVYNFILSSDHKPFIFFRTWAPDHFEYGEWFSGGVCNRTSPYSEGQYKGKPIDQVLRDIEIEEFEKAKIVASGNGVRLKLLDTFHLSLLRPDGHPGPYRTFHPFNRDENARVQNDCLHWCLPGPIDAWNELIMKILVDDNGRNFDLVDRNSI